MAVGESVWHHPASRLSDNSIAQEELDVPYDIKRYQRGANGISPKELSDVHPLGTAPVITDGNITLAESGAIVGESAQPPFVSWDDAPNHKTHYP